MEPMEIPKHDVHPLAPSKIMPFVCVADVRTDIYPHMNHVIYNPSLPYEERREMLKKKVKEAFNVSLPKKALDELSAIEYDMNYFIRQIKKYL